MFERPGMIRRGSGYITEKEFSELKPAERLAIFKEEEEKEADVQKDLPFLGSVISARSQLKDFHAMLEVRASYGKDTPDYEEIKPIIQLSYAGLNIAEQELKDLIRSSTEYDNELAQKLELLERYKESDKDNFDYLPIKENLERKKILADGILQRVETYQQSKVENESDMIQAVKTFRISTDRRKIPAAELAYREKILYLSIMTRESIALGDPTREFLNQIYSDPALVKFINDSWTGGGEITRNLELLEKELVEAQVSALALKKIDLKNGYENYLSSLIQDNIAACKGNEIAHEKTIEYWKSVRLSISAPALDGIEPLLADKKASDKEKILRSNDPAALLKKISAALVEDTKGVSAEQNKLIAPLVGQLIGAKATLDTAITVLEKLNKEYGINTQTYLTEIYISKAEIELVTLDEHNPKYELIKLNLNTSIQLFQSVKGLEKKTQNEIIACAKELQQEEPRSPEEILNFLNKLGKIKKLQSVVKPLKIPVANYLATQTTRLSEDIQSSLEENSTQDLKEKTRSYFDALRLQWQVEESAHPFSKADKKYNKERIQKLDLAIQAIDNLEVTNDTVKNVYSTLITNLDEIPNRPAELAFRTLKNLREIEYSIEEPTPKAEFKSAEYKRDDFNELVDEKHVDIEEPKTEKIIEEENLPDLESTAEKTRTERRNLEAEIAAELKDNSPNLENKDFSMLVIQYLNRIKDEWRAQEAEQKVLHSQAREDIINDAIENIHQQPITEINQQLIQLQLDLKETVPPPASGFARARNFMTRQSDETKKMNALHAETTRSIGDIHTLQTDHINPVVIALTAAEERKIAEAAAAREHQEALDTKAQQTETKKLFIKNTSHILSSLVGEIKAKPKFAAKHLTASNEALDEQIIQDATDGYHYQPNVNHTWIDRGIRAIAAAGSSSSSLVDSKSAHCSELENGKLREYKNKGNEACIQISHQDSCVQVRIANEPWGYDTLRDDAKKAADREIAEQAIRIWVKECGNSLEEPIPISNSRNEQRMRELVIVCKANGLAYQLPYGHPLERDPTLDAEAQALREDLRDYYSERKITMFSDRLLEDLERKVETLARDVDHLPDYKTEIDSLTKLIKDAKEGKVSAAALNTAITKLDARQQQINAQEAASIPVSRRLI